MDHFTQAEVSSVQARIEKSQVINQIDLFDLRRQCLSAKPFPYVCIDGLWNGSLLERVAAEVDALETWAGEKNFHGSQGKRWQSDWDEFPVNTRGFIQLLNSPLILNITEIITNETGLIPDPYLQGGGIHSIGQGGFLRLHADFNWSRKLRLQRRINILVYLNKDWKQEYGGQLELAGPRAGGQFSPVVSLDPCFNRTVIFITTDESFHGNPVPVKSPENRRRNSIAAYYYQSLDVSDHNRGIRTETDYLDDSNRRIANGLLAKISRKISRTLNGTPN
jgi:hypothetical protein